MSAIERFVKHCSSICNRMGRISFCICIANNVRFLLECNNCDNNDAGWWLIYVC